MNAETRTSGFHWWLYFGIVATLLSLSAADTVLAADQPSRELDETDRVRVSRSLRIPERTREKYSKLEKTESRYQALSLDGTRSPPAGQKSVDHDFWFYTADVILFNDDDLDGYYWGIDLLFDVDTYYSSADVYAVLYLSFEGGPWNEYAVTETFTIFGATGGDEYVMISELVSGYPTGYYDILIELFDPYDGAFLASYGPEDTSELSFLPLEDSNRDAPDFDPPVVINHGGGGALDWWSVPMMLLWLLGATLRQHRERRRAIAVRSRDFHRAYRADARAHRKAQ